MEQTTIQFDQAVKISQKAKAEKEQLQASILREVKESNFECYNARDISYFAEILEISSNEVRHINMEAQGVSSFDLIGTFEDDETDDMIDFF